MSPSKKIFAEFLGTAALLLVVVGSGIMGANLSGNNLAISLLANSIATGAGLFVLIQMFSPISGAHINPLVSLFEFSKKNLTIKELIAYVVAQISGAISGVFTTHYIFGLSTFQRSGNQRSEFRLYVSEVIATFGLLLVIALVGKKEPRNVPAGVALYIMSAYWFTSSTSFANPAVTIARSLTDTFSGIHSSGVLGFICAQFIGLAIAVGTLKCFDLK